MPCRRHPIKTDRSDLDHPNRASVSTSAGLAPEVIARCCATNGPGNRCQVAAAATADLTPKRPADNRATSRRGGAADLLLLAGRRGASRQSDDGAKGNGENLDHSFDSIDAAVKALAASSLKPTLLIHRRQFCVNRIHCPSAAMTRRFDQEMTNAFGHTRAKAEGRSCGCWQGRIDARCRAEADALSGFRLGRSYVRRDRDLADLIHDLRASARFISTLRAVIPYMVRRLCGGAAQHMRLGAYGDNPDRSGTCLAARSLASVCQPGRGGISA